MIHILLLNMIEKIKELKNKKILRYMVFLTDWNGDTIFVLEILLSINGVLRLITWDPIVHHCGANAGMTPKITLNITGLVSKKSLHLKKGLKLK